MNKLTDRQKEVIQYELDQEKEVLRQLEKHYQTALNDIDRRIRILESDELTQSKIYRIEYQKALRKQVEATLEKLHADEYATIQGFLSDSYTTGFVGTAYDMFGQGVPLIMPIDQNAAVKAIITDSKIDVSLYESLGVDTNKLKKTITAEITRGIAAGLPHSDIARNLANAAKVSLGRAKTIVRTESHRIQEASAQDARKMAVSRGASVVKQWKAIKDGKVRHTHRLLDGQVREVDEPFELYGMEAMYPGDFGDPSMDCNCRCRATQRSKIALGKEEYQNLQERARSFGLMEEDSKEFGHEKGKVVFSDFIKKYISASNKINLGETQWITKKNKQNDFSVNADIVNTKKYHDKFESLTGHKQADEAAYQHAMRMLEHRDGTEHEDMVLIDSRTGKLITQNVTSAKLGRTGLTDEQYADYLKHSGTITIVHNHPNSSRISFTDIKTMFDNDKVDVIIAVGHDGSVYKVHSPNRNFDIAKFGEMVYNKYINMYQNERIATIKMTDDLYALGVFEFERR